MISIPLILSENHPCSYLPDEIAKSAFVHPVFKMSSAIYSELIKQGFRRSGGEVYSPHCVNCSACIPARVNVAEFKPNRRQKRCLAKNVDTEIHVVPADFYPEHYAMYLRYQAARHEGGNMQSSTASEYIQFLKSPWCVTWFVEFRIAGELSAVAVVDEIDDGLSAVYTFFEPKFSAYSPGTFAILWQVNWAKQLQKEFVYLGFWIKDSEKMSYKNDYQPLQVLQNKQWQVVTEG
jgi:leucyl-tRNA---protein transferase